MTDFRLIYWGFWHQKVALRNEMKKNGNVLLVVNYPERAREMNIDEQSKGKVEKSSTTTTTLTKKTRKLLT